MRFFSSTSDILSVNLNDWAERFEDPEAMLRHAVCEMELTIEQLTQRSAQAVATEKITDRECQRNGAESDKWHSRAEKAARAGDDELARKALIRRGEFRKVRDALVDQLASLRETMAALRRQLEALEAKHAEAKRRLAVIEARKRAVEFRKTFERSCSSPPKVDNLALGRLHRLRECIEQIKAEADALAELLEDRDRQGACNEANRTVQMDLERELAELKNPFKTS
jgi:phage shock protein A